MSATAKPSDEKRAIAAFQSAPAASTIRSMQDNQAMRALFTLPPATHRLAVAPQDLPPIENITGDKEVDAVLWLRNVISTGSQPLIDKAMEAAKRIRTPLKTLEERYRQFEIQRSRQTGRITLIFDFTNLDGLAKEAVRLAGVRGEAMARFGSKDALFDEQPAETLCRKALRGLKSPRDDLGLEVYNEDEADKRFAKVITLAPHTLADCLFIQQYWTQLYWLRNSMERYGGDTHRAVNEHGYFCDRALARIPPRSKDEALAVLEYIFKEDGKGDEVEQPILRNLVARGEDVTQ